VGDEKKTAPVEELVTKTTELLDKVDETMKSVDDKIERAEKNWKGELKEVTDTIEAYHEKATGASKDELIKAVQDVTDQQFKEMRSRGEFADQRATPPTLIDSWCKGQDHPFRYDTDQIPEFLSKGAEVVFVDEKEKDKLKGVDMVMAMPNIDDAHKAFCHMGTDVMLLDAMGRAACGQADVDYPGFPNMFPKFAKKWAHYVNAYAQHVKATVAPMDTVDTSNWVPTGWSNEIRELILYEARLSPVFPSFPQPTKVFDLPTDLTDSVGDYIPETTTYVDPYAASDPMQLGQTLTDAKKQLTAFKFRSRLMESLELDEDALVAMLPFMRMKVVRILANSRDKAHIDGQATGTIDTGDVPGTYDVRKPYDGLRYFCNAASSEVDFAGTLSAAGLMGSMPQEMGEFAMDIGDLIHLTSPAGFFEMVQLTQVLTKDVLGDAATILRGQLGGIGGVPILVNRYVRADLTAAGIYDGVTTDFTIDLLFRRSAWIIGDRHRVTVTATYLPPTDQWDVIAIERYSFGNLFGTSYKTGVVGIEIPNS
jgi:uncharacterized protein YihD (DUF1040 family)